jgi:hypothetical protein
MAPDFSKADLILILAIIVVRCVILVIAGRNRVLSVASGIVGGCSEPLSSSTPQRSGGVFLRRLRKAHPSCSSGDYTNPLSTLVMFQEILARVSPSSIVAFSVFALVTRLLYNKYGNGLNHIPGPFFAGFTDFYRLSVARGYRPERWHIRLHQQYGDLVRLGPRTVLCSSNKAARKIYALNAGFVKVGR